MFVVAVAPDDLVSGDLVSGDLVSGGLVTGGVGDLVALTVWSVLLAAWLIFLFTAAWNIVIGAVRRAVGLEPLGPVPATVPPEQRCRRRDERADPTVGGGGRGAREGSRPIDG